VHHNTVCGGLVPYSIAAGDGSDFNAIHHNVARWISVYGDGNLVHNNTAQLPGSYRYGSAARRKESDVVDRNCDNTIRTSRTRPVGELAGL
jgi:hypothetical protein